MQTVRFTAKRKMKICIDIHRLIDKEKHTQIQIALFFN